MQLTRSTKGATPPFIRYSLNLRRTIINRSLNTHHPSDPDACRTHSALNPSHKCA